MENTLVEETNGNALERLIPGTGSSTFNMRIDNSWRLQSQNAIASVVYSDVMENHIQYIKEESSTLVDCIQFGTRIRDKSKTCNRPDCENCKEEKSSTKIRGSWTSSYERTDYIVDNTLVSW